MKYFANADKHLQVKAYSISLSLQRWANKCTTHILPLCHQISFYSDYTIQKASFHIYSKIIYK